MSHGHCLGLEILDYVPPARARRGCPAVRSLGDLLRQLGRVAGAGNACWVALALGLTAGLTLLVSRLDGLDTWLGLSGYGPGAVVLSHTAQGR
jgi:hypothetical protein